MIKILLADDHGAIRAGLRAFIGDLIPSSSIEEANNGDTALKKIKGNNFSFIILDQKIKLIVPEHFSCFQEKSPKIIRFPRYVLVPNGIKINFR